MQCTNLVVLCGKSNATVTVILIQLVSSGFPLPITSHHSDNIWQQNGLSTQIYYMQEDHIYCKHPTINVPMAELLL